MAIFRRRPKPTQLRDLDELRPMIESGQPVLIDFYQFGCGPCQIMDGIVNELAEEYEESAHIVKVNVQKVPGAAQVFAVRSTPTFVLLSTAPTKSSKKKQAKQQPSGRKGLAPKWRTSGLVRKDQLKRVLESNGATPAA
jgi:thiol-disulfide isomerase/thioredoxin